MKNFKKFLFFILFVLIVGSFIYLVFLRDKTKASEEDVKKIEDISLNYVPYLKNGYGTFYGGTDLLFTGAKISTDDLSVGSKLLTSLFYASDKGYDLSVNTNTINSLNKDSSINYNDYSAYNGAGLRKASIELFGEDYTGYNSVDELNFGYDFIYNQKYDIYFMKKNRFYVDADSEYSMLFKLGKTVTGKKVKVELYVIYLYKNGEEYSFATDPNIQDIVLKNTDIDVKLEKKQLEKFTKYIITYTSNDNGYHFDSIEKK